MLRAASNGGTEKRVVRGKSDPVELYWELQLTLWGVKKIGNCCVTLRDWNILRDKVEQDLSFGCECSRV